MSIHDVKAAYWKMIEKRAEEDDSDNSFRSIVRRHTEAKKERTARAVGAAAGTLAAAGGAAKAYLDSSKKSARSREAGEAYRRSRDKGHGVTRSALSALKNRAKTRVFGPKKTEFQKIVGDALTAGRGVRDAVASGAVGNAVASGKSLVGKR